MTDDPVRDRPTDENLDDRVRRVDPDRWLASRFIGDAAVRAVVVAIYALNDELARVGSSITQPLAGEIRLAWWRERIEAIAAGEAAPPQPVLQALQPAIASGRLPPSLLDALIEARHADFENRPFADEGALARYLDGTAGAVMGLAARALDPQAPLPTVVEAGRAWGLAGLYRAREVWRARERSWVPTSWGPLDDAGLSRQVAAEVDRAIDLVRHELQGLSVTAFPAVAYATLAKSYAHGRACGELGRRLRMTRAVATGRL